MVTLTENNGREDSGIFLFSLSCLAAIPTCLCVRSFSKDPSVLANRSRSVVCAGGGPIFYAQHHYLLRRMQQLLGDSAGPNPDNKFLRELFLQRLPNNVRMVLASAGDMSLEDLAQLADKIMEVATPTVSAVHISPLGSEVEHLRAEISILKEALASLQLPSTQHHSSHSRSSSRAGSHSSSSTPTHTSDKSTLCW